MPEKTILIVDDDPETHDLIEFMLRDTTWETERALSAPEALTRLENRAYDVILTDIMMPEMDGLTLLNRIHASNANTKVVVMTAFNNTDRVVGSMRGQAAGYLSKPFSKETLVESLMDALSSHAAPDDIEVLSDKPNWISVRARCKLETANRLVRFFRELTTDLDADSRDLASLAFRELLINAVEHGGHFDPEQKVELHFVRTTSSIVYYVRDPGPGFSLDKLPHAAVSHPDSPFAHSQVREELGIRPGGFGLLLLKNFADELIYNAKGNEVILIKRL